MNERDVSLTDCDQERACAEKYSSSRPCAHQIHNKVRYFSLLSYLDFIHMLFMCPVIVFIMFTFFNCNSAYRLPEFNMYVCVYHMYNMYASMNNLHHCTIKEK